MSRKVTRKKMKSFAKKYVAHLCSRVSSTGYNYVAVHEYLIGTRTSRSMCYLERNTSRGGEVSRKVIKIKNEIICKIMWLTSAAASPPLDPTTLRSAGTSPLVLDIVVKTGKNTKGGREASRSGNSYVCTNES